MADVALPAILDIQQAAPLRDRLLELKGQAVALDASSVERLGALCLQVILAARLSWARDGNDLSIVGASDAFVEQWGRFGAPDGFIATGARA